MISQGSLVECLVTRGGPDVRGHYCAIVAEFSRLLDKPGLWAHLLRHLRQVHGRKRLI